MKIKVSDVLAAAKHYGFDGDDPVAAKTFCDEQGVEFEGTDGAKLASKSCTVEAEQPVAKTFKLTPASASQAAGAAAQGETNPGDLTDKVKAMVAAELRRHGVGGTVTRPNQIDGTRVTSVKDKWTRVYEDQAKAGKTFFRDVETARACQHYLNYMIAGGALKNLELQQSEYAKFQKVHEQATGKAYTTTGATAGAALMPELFIPDLIRNVTEAGVARSLARVLPMAEAQIVIPRRASGPTIYFQQENVQPTASQSAWDNVTLNAQTMIGLSQASNQTLQDSGLPFVDIVMQDFATAIAQKEDDCFFVGDGSATYGGIVGLENPTKFAATAADGGFIYHNSAVTDAGAWTAALIARAIARVPKYARKNMRITCSTAMKSIIFDRLAVSVGGLTIAELTGFGLVDHWMRIPIIENNSMSMVEDAGATARGLGFTNGDQIDFLIGDFSRGVIFGDRMAVEMSVSQEAGFTTNSTWLRAVERIDVNFHSPGTSTAAGPIVAAMQT